MKSKSLLYILISASVLIVSCEKNPDVRMPEMKTAVTAYLKTAETSDVLMDLNDLAAFLYEAEVNVLFNDPFQKLTVVVVMNGDYANQYPVIDNITSVPQNISITAADLVTSVPALNSLTDFEEGDAFNFFVNVTLTDGTLIPGYTVSGVITASSSERSNLINLAGAAMNMNIPVPCAFNLSDYLGTLNCTEDWGGGEIYEYTVDVEEDPEYTGENIGLRITGIFDGAGVSVSRFEIITKTLSVVDEGVEQKVMDDVSVIGFPAAYGALYLQPITGGVVSTCLPALEFDAAWCVDIGCFGGGPHYTITPNPFPAKSTKTSVMKSHKTAK